MCNEGELPWFRTRGELGHLRIPVEALEQLRESGGARATVPAVKRDDIADLKADLDKRKLQREMKRLDEEDAATKRERDTAARTERIAAKARLREATILANRDAERRKAARQAEERAKWRRDWIEGVRQELPPWLSEAQQQSIVAAAGTELNLWDMEDDNVGPALDHVIERMIAPWRSAHEEQLRRDQLIKNSAESLGFIGANLQQKARAAADLRVALCQLPLGVSDWELQAAVTKAIAPIRQEIEDDRARGRRTQLVRNSVSTLGWNATEQDRADAAKAVNEALGSLPLSAGIAEEQTLAGKILAPMKKTIQDRVAVEQESARRERQKGMLIAIALLTASRHLSDIRDDLDPFPDDEEFFELDRETERKVRAQLQEELTGEESQDDANRLACDLADELVLGEEAR